MSNAYGAARLSLANGRKVAIIAVDEPSAMIVERLNEIMNLNQTGICDLTIFLRGSACSDITVKNRTCDNSLFQLLRSPFWRILPTDDRSSIECILSTKLINADLPLQLMQVANLVALLLLDDGGLLLHGAFARLNGSGVVLAGKGGMGKTTASNRLPLPWQSLSDDATLAVLDDRGSYWGHPWPTWSRFFLDRACDSSWQVEEALPIKALFFLSQDEKDEVQSIGVAEAVPLIVEAAIQASLAITNRLGIEDIQAFHRKIFDNSCRFSRMIPSYILKISLNGEFWREIEPTIRE
jgi:SynChlorMet cassette protein ScmC